MSATAGPAGLPVLSSCSARELPVAVTLFPRDLPRPTRGWIELAYPNLVYCNEADRGGHFAALEQPRTLIDDICAGLRALRPKK